MQNGDRFPTQEEHEKSLYCIRTEGMNIFSTDEDNKKFSSSLFMKDDSLKPMLSLVEPQFLLGLADVLTFGAKKYERDNWKLCEDTSRYKDALLRHIYKYLDGEIIDQETGLSHLSHAACNLMFLQHFDNKGN